MAEDRKDGVDVEEKTEVVETDAEEKTEVVETDAEEKTEDTLPDLVEKIRTEYETRLGEMEAKHAAAIADRDAIIQQLISGNPSGNVSRETFVDRLNEKREFKKW